MATVIIRINSSNEETEFFLIDCTSKVELLLKKAQRGVTTKSGYALFTTLLCQTMPSFDSLSTRHLTLENSFKILEKSKYFEIDPKVIRAGRLCNNAFFKSPYGIFKTLKDPKPILDPSSNFRISVINIQNDLDLETFDQLLGL